MRQSSLFWLAVVAGVLAASGCFNPRYSEGVECSEVDSCPPGMECRADGRCWLVGRECVMDSECASGVCDMATGGCAAASCSDGVRNGDEVDVDCGGACAPCGAGRMCERGSDCQSLICEVGGVCAAARCGDGVVNSADEQCDDGNDSDNDDCLSTCVAASCGDGIVWNEGAGAEECDDANGNDNDDCPSTCVFATCGDGFVWNEGDGDEECDDANADDSDTCTTVCKLASCTDRIKNADELDVDCGGHCGPRSCWGGQTCTDDSDCASGSCESGVCKAGGAVIVAGIFHTCALDAAGAVRCWGYNAHGELGYGHTNNIGDNELPSSAGTVDVGGAVVQLAAGAHHTCALLDTSAIRCWGRNSEGQLGYGHISNIGDNELPSSAGDVGLGGTAVHITAGHYHTCALLDTGAVRCWGYNGFGQLGYGHTTHIGDNELPSTAGDVSLGGTAVQITAGVYHTCALLDTGAIRCWGYNGHGQLGYGHTSNIGDNELPSTAGDVSLGGQAAHVDAGFHHTCALLDTGAIRCWGYNGYGQLGYGHTSYIGDNELPSSVEPVSLGDTATLLTSGGYHTCALLSSGGLRCWGYNGHGELGYGHTSNIGDNELPSSVGDVSVGGDVVQLAVGRGYHTCARLTTGALRCWGNNGNGQLGYGHTSQIGDDELPSSAGDVPYQ